VVPDCRPASCQGRCRSHRPRRTGSTRAHVSARARRPASPHPARWHAETFFPGPPALLGDRPAHRRMTDPNPGDVLPPLALLFERRIRVARQPSRQRGCQADRLPSRRAGPRRLRQTPGFPLPTTPARQGCRRYPEQPDHLRPGRPQIQRIQRPDPQISRIATHPVSLTKRSPLAQAAVGCTKVRRDSPSVVMYFTSDQDHELRYF
jgi:hypothetical protein